MNRETEKLREREKQRKGRGQKGEKEKMSKQENDGREKRPVALVPRREQD